MEQAINTTNQPTTTCEDTMKRCPTDNWKPGESMVIASVDPPQTLDGGVGTGTDALATGGGTSGFINHATIWDAFAGRPDCLNDTSDFLAELDDNPRLRSSANLRTLSRVRSELERLPESTDLSDPVELRLQDVLVLMNQLMARMR